MSKKGDRFALTSYLWEAHPYVFTWQILPKTSIIEYRILIVSQTLCKFKDTSY